MAKRDRQETLPSTQAPRDSRPSTEQAPGVGAAKRWWTRTGVLAAAIFVVLLAAYSVNGGFLYGNDAKPNVYLPSALLGGAGFTFTPSEYPFMFYWVCRTDEDWVPVLIDAWDQSFKDQPYTYRQLLQAGRLRLYQPRYYLVRSNRMKASGEPVCVNTFGPGAAITALPVFAVLHLAVGGDLRAHPAVMWYGGKAVASLLVAGSAVFIFLTARAFTRTGPAALIALAYGLGTGVWSTSSQTLWQHGPNEFFLAMGAYFLTQAEKSWKHAAACGAALSAAVACRPTSIVVAAAVAVYLLVRLVADRRAGTSAWEAGRRALVPYVLAALPIAILLAIYNTYYLGSPWDFGQAKVGHDVAMTKTGTDALWQTPLLTGAAGLMVSPSRGLLVFSPFMVFALAGLVLLWTHRRYAPLWPLAAAMLVLLAIAFKWFDWWGGWCYGPRPIVDTMPYFVLMLIPVIEWVCRRRAVLAVFLLLLVWSVGVQALGAFTYEMFGWNKAALAEVYVAGRSKPILAETPEEVAELAKTHAIQRIQERSRDIDDAAYRNRLWSWSDNQIFYYLRNASRARQLKAQYVDIYLNEPSR